MLTNRPCSSFVHEESDSKERLRVSNWIVQRLYHYAVKKTVELRLVWGFRCQSLFDSTPSLTFDGSTVLDVPRGIRRSARIIAPHTCIRWVDETRTMMQ